MLVLSINILRSDYYQSNCIARTFKSKAMIRCFKANLWATAPRTGLLSLQWPSILAKQS